MDVYCRGYLPVCDENPCLNDGQCDPNGAASICVCRPGYTGQLCETHLEQPCGDILHLAPPDIEIPNKWHQYCYLGLNDTLYLDYQCHLLLEGLPNYANAEGLLAAGGNFGCWLAPSYPDIDLPNACVKDYQHNRALGTCVGCQFMGVCIQFPPPSLRV